MVTYLFFLTRTQSLFHILEEKFAQLEHVFSNNFPFWNKENVEIPSKPGFIFEHD